MFGLTCFWNCSYKDTHFMSSILSKIEFSGLIGVERAKGVGTLPVQKMRPGFRLDVGVNT